MKKWFIIFFLGFSYSAQAQIGSILKANILAYQISAQEFHTAIQLVKDEPSLLFTPSESGLLPLNLAISQNNLPLIKAFVTLGAPLQHPNYKHQPLEFALLLNSLKTLSLLLDLGADPDIEIKKGLTLLHLAIILNNEDALKILLKHKANINIPDRKGMTPLHMAVVIKNWKIIQVLAQYHANPLIFDKQGNTVLTWQINNHSSKEELKFVLDLFPTWQSQMVNTTFQKIPLLIKEVLEDNIDIVTLLLKKGANINAVDKNENTPLMLAIIHKNENMIQLLLSFHPNLTMKNKENQTALSLAQSLNNEEIIKLLNP